MENQNSPQDIPMGIPQPDPPAPQAPQMPQGVDLGGGYPQQAGYARQPAPQGYYPEQQSPYARRPQQSNIGLVITCVILGLLAVGLLIVVGTMSSNQDKIVGERDANVKKVGELEIALNIKDNKILQAKNETRAAERASRTEVGGNGVVTGDSARTITVADFELLEEQLLAAERQGDYILDQLSPEVRAQIRSKEDFFVQDVFIENDLDGVTGKMKIKIIVANSSDIDGLGLHGEIKFWTGTRITHVVPFMIDRLRPKSTETVNLSVRQVQYDYYSGYVSASGARIEKR